MSRRAVSTDARQKQMCEILPSSEGCQGRPLRDHRRVVEGIVYRYRTGIAGRDLPEEFGPWQTVWKRHRRSSVDGTWDRLLTGLLTGADAAGEIDRSVSADSTINRAHQHAATLPRPAGGTDELQEIARRAG